MNRSEPSGGEAYGTPRNPSTARRLESGAVGWINGGRDVVVGDDDDDDEPLTLLLDRLDDTRNGVETAGCEIRSPRNKPYFVRT